jgi:hypothetical protein
MATTTLPESHADLLVSPNFAHLATVRPDGSPQSSVMWFDWDGSRLRLTHTGNVESIEDDDEVASFYKSLQTRYGMDYPIPDAAVRVIITIKPESYVAVSGGSVVS